MKFLTCRIISVVHGPLLFDFFILRVSICTLKDQSQSMTIGIHNR